MALNPINEVPLSPPGRNDSYIHMTGFENINPDIVDIALRTHAIGYSEDMGFVHSEAIGEDGYLSPDIDKARGPNVEYHVAVDPDNDNNRATMRIINLNKDQTVEDLPAFQTTKNALTEDGEAELRSVEPASLKEISALAKSSRKAAVGLFEILRKTVQESVGRDETWFFSIVSDTYESLARRLGRNAFTILGADVPIDDDRVDSSKVRLRPIMFRPDDFFESMHDSATNPESGEDEVTRQRVAGSLLFFTEGLSDDLVGEKVAGWRKETLSYLGSLAVK